MLSDDYRDRVELSRQRWDVVVSATYIKKHQTIWFPPLFSIDLQTDGNQMFFSLLIVRVASCIHSMGVALGRYLPGFQYACGGELLSRLHILRANVYIIMYSPLSEPCSSSMIHSCVETWCNKCSISFLEQLPLITLASLPSYKAESTEVVLSFGCTTNTLFYLLSEIFRL